MKKVKAFDKILDRIQPVLKIEELNLEVYNSEFLSKQKNLEIFDIQNEISFYYDSIQQKSLEMEELSKTQLDKDNLDKRNQITRDIQAIYEKINISASRYIEVVCKLEKGELEERIDEFYEKNPQFSEYPKDKMILDIQKTINSNLLEFSQKELGVSESDNTAKK